MSFGEYILNGVINFFIVLFVICPVLFNLGINEDGMIIFTVGFFAVFELWLCYWPVDIIRKLRKKPV